MDQIKEIMEQVSDRLAATASSDVVAGAPIQLGGLTVVTLSRVSLGLGAGGGVGEGDTHQGKSATAKGEGGGTGGGAKVRPVAVVVLSEAGVEVLPISDKQGKLDRLLDAIPALVERVQRARKKEE